MIVATATLVPHIPFHNVTRIILSPIYHPPRWPILIRGSPNSITAMILGLFKFLATEFEQRGVQFIEIQTELQEGLEPMKDIIHSLQQGDPNLYSSEILIDIARSFPLEL